MKTFLKTKSVVLDGENVTITQLSGFDRFEFLDYCTDLEKPKEPVKPEDESDSQAQEIFLQEMEKCLKRWGRVNFGGQSRLVAYGYVLDDEELSLDERHQQIMSSMTPEQVKVLHDEIARFSGIPLPEPVDETNESDSVEEAQEPADPKG